jgi:hypothetical protein
VMIVIIKKVAIFQNFLKICGSAIESDADNASASTQVLLKELSIYAEEANALFRNHLIGVYLTIESSNFKNIRALEWVFLSGNFFIYNCILRLENNYVCHLSGYRSEFFINITDSKLSIHRSKIEGYNLAIEPVIDENYILLISNHCSFVLKDSLITQIYIKEV